MVSVFTQSAFARNEPDSLPLAPAVPLPEVSRRSPRNTKAKEQSPHKSPWPLCLPSVACHSVETFSTTDPSGTSLISLEQLSLPRWVLNRERIDI